MLLTKNIKRKDMHEMLSIFSENVGTETVIGLYNRNNGTRIQFHNANSYAMCFKKGN